jgi:tetratricopeptide (TPR) repeat protein
MAYVGSDMPRAASPGQPVEGRSVENLLARADALAEVGRLDEARDAVGAALALDHADSRVWMTDSWLARRRGDYDTAVASAGRAVVLRPESPTAIGELALALAVAGRPHEAVARVFDAAGRAPEDPWVATVASIVFRLAGRYGDAVAAAEALLRLAPDEVESHDLAARACDAAGRLDVAERHARAALALDPQRGATVALLGDLVERQGRREEALAWYIEAFRIDPHHEHVMVAARRLHTAGEARVHLAVIAIGFPVFGLLGGLAAWLTGWDGSIAVAYALLLAAIWASHRLVVPRGPYQDELKAMRAIQRARQREAAQGGARIMWCVPAGVLALFGLVSLIEVSVAVALGCFAGAAAVVGGMVAYARRRPLPEDVRAARRAHWRQGLPALALVSGGLALMAGAAELTSAKTVDRVAGVVFCLIGTGLLVTSALAFRHNRGRPDDRPMGD